MIKLTNEEIIEVYNKGIRCELCDRIAKIIHVNPTKTLYFCSMKHKEKYFKERMVNWT